MYIYSIYVYIGELVSGYIYTHTQDIAGIFSNSGMRVYIGELVSG